MINGDLLVIKKISKVLLIRTTYTLILTVITHGNTFACQEEPSLGREVVFAKISPLIFSKSQDFKKTTLKSLDFGTSFPVLENLGSTVSICFKGEQFWVRKSQIIVSNSSRKAQLTSINLDNRPKLLFWKNRDKLASFLSKPTSVSTHDYEELSSTKEKKIHRFPYNTTDYMDTSISNRQVEVISLLIPIPYRALKIYDDIANNSFNKKNIIIICDVSNSTKGFLNTYLNILARRLSQTKEALGASINLIPFRDGKTLLPIKNLTLNELQEYTFPGLSPVSTDNHEKIGLEKALSVADMMDTSDTISQLFILGGGDVSHNSPNVPFSSPVIINITPEKQTELRELASKIKGASFFSFTERNAEKLLLPLIKKFDASTNRLKLLDKVKAEFKKYNLLPVIPSDLDSHSPILPPANADINTEWFAISPWTVLNKQIISIHEKSK